MPKLLVDEIAKNTESVVTFEDPIDLGSNKIISTGVPSTDTNLVTYAYTRDALHKNYIINGAMNIAQRGTSFAVTSSLVLTYYTLDRWIYVAIAGDAKGTLPTHTVSQDTDVPTGITTQYSLKIDCTQVPSAIPHCVIGQRIEGYIFRPLVGKTATLSFWVKSTKIGTYCVSFVNPTGDRSYVSEYTINVASTWEYKTITLTFDYSGGTWNYTSLTGISVWFMLSESTTYQTSTTDTWLTGQYYASWDQVDTTDSTDNNFWITEVMLNEGSIAQPFRMFMGDWTDELFSCQRYYEKSFNYGTTPADATTSYAGVSGVLTDATNSYHPFMSAYYKVRKRSAVKPVFYNPGASNANKIRNTTDNTNVPGSCQQGDTAFGTTGFSYQVNNSSIAANKQLTVHWVDDAEDYA